MSNLPDFDALWNYERPDETERAFRALLPAAAASPGYELELLTQIARAQGLQRQFAAAHAALDAVEVRLTPEYATAQLRLLLERGRLFNSAGDPHHARPFFEQAWQQAQAADEPGYAVDAAHMLGILDSPALDWNLKALQLAETSSDERARRWRASLCNNIGWAYHDAGDYPQALAMFERALALREQQGKPEPIHVAKWMVGRALRSLGRLDEALAIQQQLTGADDPYVEEELGECLLALGRAEAAKAHFAAAYAVLGADDLLMKYEAARLERMKVLAGA